jgi:hypothetical protein
VVTQLDCHGTQINKDSLLEIGYIWISEVNHTLTNGRDRECQGLNNSIQSAMIEVT